MGKFFDQLFNAGGNGSGNQHNDGPNDTDRRPGNKQDQRRWYEEQADEATKEGNGDEEPKDGKLW